VSSLTVAIIAVVIIIATNGIIRRKNEKDD